MKNRIQAVRELLVVENLDGYIVSNEISILYFTGFLGGAKLLITKSDEAVLYVHGVNYEDAKETARECQVELVKRGEDVNEKVVERIKGKTLEHVGFDTLDASTYLKIAEALKGVELKARGELVWRLRKIKDENELKYMRKAAELTDEGMKTAFEAIKPGIRENELAAEIEYNMRRMGSEGLAFDTIVASGVRSATCRVSRVHWEGCDRRAARPGVTRRPSETLSRTLPCGRTTSRRRPGVSPRP